jgi:hypothetical protein
MLRTTEKLNHIQSPEVDQQVVAVVFLLGLGVEHEVRRKYPRVVIPRRGNAEVMRFLKKNSSGKEKRSSRDSRFVVEMP